MRLFVIISVFVVCVSCGKLNAANVNECGKEESTNLIHHNPWLIYLEYYDEDGLRNIRCAATLIGSRHALTAAHCVKKALFTELVARLGEYDLNSDEDSFSGVVAEPVKRIQVVNVIVHEGYDGKNDDIAVLVLGEDAPYTDFIRPICLPTGTVADNELFEAAGWGEYAYTHVYAHIKKVLLLPYWSREKCQKAYSRSSLPSKVICAGGEEGIDTCRGDSGGPLTLVRGKIKELWGITSSGNVHCGASGSPGIYTSVKEHLNWIREVVAATSKIFVA